MRTPVNSIQIPDKYVDLCCEWHGSIHCMLYAVSSTGGLTLGRRSPGESRSDEQWYLSLWQSLSSDVMRARLAAEEGSNGEYVFTDAPLLLEFENWVDAIVDRLTEEYDLADWGS